MKPIKSIYVIGSLRNPAVPDFCNKIAELGIEAFASWHGASAIADDAWKEYQQIRGLNFGQALKEYAAQNVYNFDKTHLDRTDAAVLLMPGGKSAHLELGYTIGKGKPGYIVFESEPPTDRWDVMLNFATEVCFSYGEFFEILKQLKEN